MVSVLDLVWSIKHCDVSHFSTTDFMTVTEIFIFSTCICDQDISNTLVHKSSVQQSRIQRVLSVCLKAVLDWHLTPA